MQVIARICHARITEDSIQRKDDDRRTDVLAVDPKQSFVDRENAKPPVWFVNGDGEVDSSRYAVYEE